MKYTRIVSFIFYKIMICIPIIAISSCGGGGGGGSGGTGGSSALVAEFNANYGLTNIGAARAFNAGSTGAGIIVGVVDTGIDLTHTEFTGRISANSTNIVSPGSSVQDTDGHGTAISGVIAAARDSSSVVGVAQSSTILALKASTTSAVFFDSDVATAIDTGVAQGARVINLSLGGPTRASAALQTSMQNAVNNGVILVLAVGNDFLTNSAFNARMAACAGAVDATCNGFNAQGLVVAVMSTDESNNRSSFSNRCGDAATACLGAPGTNIVTTAIGGETQTSSGTSLSAPHVSGALALVLQAFPTLSASQAVNLLLTTATDLGSLGVDTIFGNGLLNLTAAFQNQGLSLIPTGSNIGSTSIPLTSTSLSLGASFGNALSNNEFLNEAIIIDGFQRPFKVDLRNTIVNAETKSNLSQFIFPNNYRNFTNQITPKTSVNFSFKNKSLFFENNKVLKKSFENNIKSFTFLTSVSNGLTLQFASNTQPTDVFKENIVPFPLFAINQTVLPQFNFLNQNDGTSINIDINEKAYFSYGFLNSNANSDILNQNDNTLHQTFAVYKPNEETILQFGFGLLKEKNTFLNSKSSGIFGNLNNNHSNFLTIGAKSSITDNWHLFGTYAEVIGDAPNNSGFFSDWGKIRANAISAGISSSNTFIENDKIAFSLYQPMRVYKANANLTLPIGTEPRPNGQILYKTERISIKPSDRQIDFQAAYSWKSKFIQTSAFGLLSINPGHDGKEKNDYTFGIKTGINF